MREIRTPGSALARAETRSVAKVMRDLTSLHHPEGSTEHTGQRAAMDVVESVAASREGFSSVSRPVRRIHIRRAPRIASSADYQMVRQLARGQEAGTGSSDEGSMKDGKKYLLARQIGIAREELHDVDSGKAHPKPNLATKAADTAFIFDLLAMTGAHSAAEMGLEAGTAALMAIAAALFEFRNRRQYRLAENGRLLREIDRLQQEQKKL